MSTGSEDDPIIVDRYRRLTLREISRGSSWDDEFDRDTKAVLQELEAAGGVIMVLKTLDPNHENLGDREALVALPALMPRASVAQWTLRATELFSEADEVDQKAIFEHNGWVHLPILF